MVLEFLPYVLPYVYPFLIYALVGIVSLYMYNKLKKTGFLLIGIGFLVNAVAPLVRLALGGPYIVSRLAERGLTVTEISLFLFYYVTLVDWSLLTVLAVLVLVGLFLLMKEITPKQIS
jgi:hypothetical protein